jgi:hypothetical protein
MIKRLIALLFCLSALPLCAQTGYTTVQSTHFTDSTGALITNATIQFSPVAANGTTPIAYQVNGNGQATFAAVQTQVTGGVFSLHLADTNLTQPRNVCFSVTVTDNASGNTLLGALGYACVQPQWTAYWCVAGACNFDAYQPNLAPLALTQTGPPGPQGPAGPTGSIGPGLSGATYIAPSGDTTGATDCGPIQAACSAGTSVALGAGSYYFGHSNASCVVSTPCTILGQGPGTTVIHNEGTTNDVFVFNANTIPTGGFYPIPNPLGSGGTVGGFTILEEPSLTPTAGYGLRVGANLGVGPGFGMTWGFIFNNIDIKGTYGFIRTDPGMWENKFENMSLSNCVGSNAIYFNSPIPSGDAFFDNIMINGNSSSQPCNFYVNASDTNNFSNIKINNGKFIFGAGGVSNLKLSNIGL